VTFDIKWTFDLRNKDVKADRRTFRLGPSLPVATGEKASGRIQLSVPLAGKRIATAPILLSAHGESGLCDSARTSSFYLESPKGISLSGMHNMELFMYSITYGFWVTPKFWEVRAVTWSQTGQTKAALNDPISFHPMYFAL
jgi:hypothetical protein